MLPSHLISGMSREDILNYFYEIITYKGKKRPGKQPIAKPWKGIKLLRDLIDANTGQVVAPTGTKLTPRVTKKLAADGLKEIQLTRKI